VSSVMMIYEHMFRFVCVNCCKYMLVPCTVVLCSRQEHSFAHCTVVKQWFYITNVVNQFVVFCFKHAQCT